MRQKNDQQIDGDGGSCELSVIITCYFEERSIEEFYDRLSNTLRSTGRSYEIVFVNDGSTDGTFARLKAIFEKDPNVTTVIDLYRNAGQLGAMTAGIVNARGRNFVFMDSDLQLNPEDLPLLLGEFDKGADIVSGCRKHRKGSPLRTIPSKLANLITRKVSGHDITDFGCTFKIYGGRLIRAFEFGPFKVFQPAYVYAKAGTVREVGVEHKERKYGKSGWTFKKLLSFFMDNFVGMSQRPFQLLSLLCFIATAVFFVRIVSAWLVPFSILPEITSGLILNVIVFHLLVTIAILSAVGEYVIRNFTSLRAYPIYVIKERLQKPLERG
jgi:glycosyltransferase involved in cell wall biosynthesis